MGRQRTAQRQQPAKEPSASYAEEEIAAAIALILAGQALPEGVGVAAAIASLLALLPTELPETDDVATVASPVARLVVADTPTLTGRSEAERRASRSNLSYRAHYAIEAFKRVAEKVRGGEGVREAFQGERRHFRQHLEANSARIAGAALNDAAAARWGPLLSWQHTGKAKTHRPSHVAADGANYRVDQPPVSTDGMLPGMALHCDCVPAAPIPGARTLR